MSPVLGQPRRLASLFTIGCESGMFMTWTSSEKYCDQQRQSHLNVWQEETKTWEDQVTEQRTEAQLKVTLPFAYDLPNAVIVRLLRLASTARRAIAFFGETPVCEDDKGHDLVKGLLLRYKAGDRILVDL